PEFADGGPPSYICRLSGKDASENWKFWLELCLLQYVPLSTAVAIFTATTVTTSQAPLGVASSPMLVPVADTSHVSTPPEGRATDSPLPGSHVHTPSAEVPPASPRHADQLPPDTTAGQGIQGTQVQVPVGYTHPSGSTHFMRPSAHTSVGQPPYYAYYSQGFGTSASLAHMQST
ncbi:hypothetical protein L7F22_008171, partial [Adiantum nelumboides]|nr:hypothetical protein [Adiantum nelumboides]